MTEQLIELLGPSSVLADKKPEIVQEFIEFNGEDSREEVEAAFKNAIFLKVCSLDNMEIIIRRIKEEVFKEVFPSSEEDPIKLDVEELEETVKSENFAYTYISNNAMKLITGSELTLNELRKGFKEGKFEKLNVLFDRWHEVKKRIAPYEKELHEARARDEQIVFEYTMKLINEFRYLVDDAEYKDYAQNRRTSIASLGIRSLFENLKKIDNPFDEETEARLKNPDTSDWEVEDIEFIRYDYLKKIYKLDHPKDSFMPTYEQFSQDPEYLKYMDDAKYLFERIMERKKELLIELNKARLEALPDYQRNKAILDQYDLVDKNYPLSPSLYLGAFSTYSMCDENILRTENGLEYTPIIVINAGTDAIDDVIFHEANHAFERHRVYSDDEKVSLIEGWDAQTGFFRDEQDYSEDLDKHEPRSHEPLSEFVNERIANEMTVDFHSKGKFFFDKRDICACAYLTLKPLFEEFYDEFKPLIRESRRGGRSGLLFDRVGADNFEALNAIANRFYEAFGYNENIYNHYLSTPEDKRIQADYIMEELVARKNMAMANMRVIFNNTANSLRW